MRFTFKRSVAVVLTLSMTWMSAKPALAMLAPVESTPVAASADRAPDLAKVQTFLEQSVVREKLAGMGLTESQIATRLASMSDAELHQVAMQIDKQNPGADGSGVVVTVLVIGILALLFFYLLKRV